MEINIHRGDYQKETLNIADSTGSQISIEFTEIYFTVKKTTNKANYLFQKTLSGGGIVKSDDGTYSIEVLPEDTDNLEFGEYVFDIELVEDTTPIKQTFLGTFNILEEVTYASNENVSETEEVEETNITTEEDTTNTEEGSE